MKTFYPNYSEPKFNSNVYFELKSFIGRNFLKKRSRINTTITTEPILLDIGVGNHFTDGWIHVDFFSFHFKFWKKKSKTRKPEIETDLRYPLSCSSNSIDGIYSGHTNEHLYPNHAFQLLDEMYRILKPQAWLRINVPDLGRMVDFYNGKISLPEFTYKAEGIGNLTQNWGHHSLWDDELLTSALKNAGFTNVKKVKYGIEGSDTRLIKEQDVRKDESICFEAQKP